MEKTQSDLKNITALLADRDLYTRGLVSQMLRSFGINTILMADNGAQAKDLLAHYHPDIALIEGKLPDMQAGELTAWIRRNQDASVRHMPIIVLSGYTQLSMIAAARDAGAHLVIRKPVSPQILFDRLVWAVNFDRAFLEAPTYAGPDRRFHEVPTPSDQLHRETDGPKPVVRDA